MDDLHDAVDRLLAEKETGKKPVISPKREIRKKPVSHRRKYLMAAFGSFLVTLLLVLMIAIPWYNDRLRLSFIEQDDVDVTPVGGWPVYWFGSRATSTTAMNIEDHPGCGYFQMNGSDGDPDNITIYCRVFTASHTIACAIYDSAWNLVATTTATSVSSMLSAGWRKFNINWTTNESCLQANAYYYITAWSTQASGNCMVYYATSGGGGVKNTSAAHTDQWQWQDPATIDTTVDADGKASVFVNYTLAVDTTPPTVTLNFAGNLSDSGGPYYRPPEESTVLSGVWSDGYYTNRSYQTESYIYLNVTAQDETSMGYLELHWRNHTTNKFYNTTRFTKKNTNYYEYNTSSNITNISAGHKYSFDIYAYDSAGNCRKVWWNKTNLDAGDTYTRRYVYLKNTGENISYIPYYLYNTTYGSSDTLTADRLAHDQGTDGTVTDTGMLSTTMLSDTKQERHCTSYVGWYFNDDRCVADFTITNIYYRIYWNALDRKADLYLAKDRDYFGAGTDHIFGSRTIPCNQNVLHSNATIYYDNGVAGGSDNYWLNTGLLGSFDDDKVTSNNMTEVYFQLSEGAQKPTVISNASYESLILINIPVNATLVGLDSDEDGINDKYELFNLSTNPFDADTDEDGVSDYGENESGSDPNNYTSTIPYTPPIAWQTVQTITGSLQNTTSWKTIQTVAGAIQNTSNWKTILTISGSIQNTTAWKTKQTITGSIQNTSAWRTVKTISGAIQNTTAWRTKQTISGTIQNTSAWKTILTISGAIQNTTAWKTRQTITGAIQNTSYWRTVMTLSGDIQNLSGFRTVQTISGAIQNTTNWRTVFTLSGEIQNLSGFRTVQTLSGAIQNTTAWKTTQTFTGDIMNLSGWQTIQTLSGAIQNISAWKTVFTLSGDIQNLSGFKTVQTLFGAIQNISTTQWHTIQNLSGAIQNVSGWKTIMVINGEIVNLSGFKTVQTISGAIQNTTAFRTTQTISGAIQNTTGFRTVQTLSGSILNLSGWHTIFTLSGSIINTSAVAGGINITMVSPNNTVVPINMILLRVSLFHYNGSLMNLTWSWNNSGTWQMLSNLTNIGNGTYGYLPSVFVFTNHTYQWRVSANSSGYPTVTRNMSFTTGNGIGGGSGGGNNHLGIIGFIGVIGIFGIIFALKKRRKT